MSNINRNLDTTQEETLDQAIAQLMAGESLGSILASSGPDSEWMEPLLVLASGVHHVRETVPVPQAQASLAQFLAEAERIAPAPSPGLARLPWWERLVNSLWLPTFSIPRLATTAVTAALLVIVLTMGSAFFLGADSAAAAQGILPGQALYPFKRLGEEVYLRLPQSHESRSARSALYEQRRRDEVHLLLGHHLEASVAFRGVVDNMGADQIVVSGITVEITDDTQVEGPLASGAQVLIVARTTRDGMLVATRAVVEGPERSIVAPAATDTVQPTVALGATAMPAAVDTLTPTQEATPTPEPEPTATPTSEPTDTPVPAAVDTREPKPEPTEEPSESPDEADNENGDEGGQNDNSNEANQNDNGDESNDNGGSDGGDGGGNDNESDGNDSSGGDDSNDNDSGGGDSGGDDISDSDSGSDSSGGDDGGDSEDRSGSSDGDNDNDNSTAWSITGRNRPQTA